jgi:hypothetical protein
LSLHESSNESSGAQTLSKLLSIHGKCRVCPRSEWAHGSSDVLLWWTASCKTRNCIQRAVLQSTKLSLFIPLIIWWSKLTWVLRWVFRLPVSANSFKHSKKGQVSVRCSPRALFALSRPRHQ